MPNLQTIVKVWIGEERLCGLPKFCLQHLRAIQVLSPKLVMNSYASTFAPGKQVFKSARPYTTIPRLKHPINKDSQSFSRPKTEVDETFRNNSSTFPSFIGPAAHPSFLSSFPSILSLEEDGLHATFQTRSSWPLPSRDKWGTWETSISTREKTWFSCLPCSAWEYTPSANMATQPLVYLLLFAAASPIFCWKTFCALPFQVQDELIHLCLDCMISATCNTMSFLSHI